MTQQNPITCDQLQKTIQSLTESRWIFAALAIITETGILALLKNKMALDELKIVTHLPQDILEQMLQLLSKTGFLVNNNQYYCWSNGLKELINNLNLEAFVAQIKFISRMNNEFIKTASTGNLKPNWYQTDEEILHAWGRLSQFFGNDLISGDPRLVQLLLKPGALFLDAGTGTANISMQLCQIYPSLKVVAIDCEDKPLELAKKNIQQAMLTDRIELRKIYLQDLKDKNLYDVVWLPQVFYSDTDYLKCLQLIWQALKPSGMIYLAALSFDNNNLSNLVSQLTNATYGSLRYVNNVIDSFEKAGFVEIKVFGEANGYKSFNGYSLISAIKP
jgi:2-polyprenyl-3-methyl-5-hydroxy-6-metoxy-1,4-benzoquinol methylase